MKEFIKMLEECGCISSLRIAETMMPVPDDVPKEHRSYLRNKARWMRVEHCMMENEEIEDAFVDVCFKMGKKVLIEELEKIMKGGDE